MLTSRDSSKYVLVTGSTGFIGAHIVDALLSRGLRVRGATRTAAKGEAMLAARPQHAQSLDFVEIHDFENPGDLRKAVQGVDAIVHAASVSPQPPLPFFILSPSLLPSFSPPSFDEVRSLAVAQSHKKAGSVTEARAREGRREGGK